MHLFVLECWYNRTKNGGQCITNLIKWPTIPRRGDEIIIWERSLAPDEDSCEIVMQVFRVIHYMPTSKCVSHIAVSVDIDEEDVKFLIEAGWGGHDFEEFVDELAKHYPQVVGGRKTIV